ncbi:2-(R)-hydroxypropyl-CoM dehydrogenase [Microbulbifer aggregans]|uniref:2-(R)-hydroxypropyl-CoM dehydrogenase n=1 Tax=Microbulbifer aggregans TaxID=1769779 RepID=A0A1C9WAH4_9GAMM|nr:SDR family NAD(P)-dependent oxidoreductase [Microbulbifer aggregans]AOS98135.1 2-(R)-hydroxypropyl-CoM dehydrogenase [Microbulbifer aggregans]
MTDGGHALISGAGSGLGFGIALRLLRRGCRVSILDLKLDSGRHQQLVSAAKAGKSQWQFFIAEITELDQVRQAISTAVEHYGPPFLALNCAGILVNRAFTDLEPDDFHRVLDVNLNGSFHFAHAALPHLQPGARLALVASLAGLTSNYGYAAYGASKFGVVGLATTLRFELQPQGIQVSCICPAEIRTPMVAREKRDAHPVSLELRKVAGSMDVDSACDQILRGLDAGKWMIIPGVRPRLLALFNRILPGTFYRICSLLLHRSLRRLDTNAKLQRKTPAVSGR